MVNSKEEKDFLEHVREISEIEYVKNSLISDHIEIINKAQSHLMRILIEETSQEDIVAKIKEDQLLHILLCARSNVNELTRTFLWNHIQDTLLYLSEMKVGERHYIFQRVVSDLVRNRNISLGVTLASELSKMATDLTTGLQGWKFMIDIYRTHSSVIERNVIYPLILKIKMK